MRAYAIALRANQFEKHEKAVEDYQTITKEDCLNAAKARGEIKCENIESLAKCLLSYIIGYNLLFFEIEKTSLEDSMKEKDTAIDAIVRGILSAE